MRFTIVILFIIVFSAAAGYFGYTYLSDISPLIENGILMWTMVIGVVLVASLITFMGLTVRYQIPKPNTALIMKSKSKEKTAIGSGFWVNTLIHKLREVPLNTMKIEIIEENVLTYDFVRCDFEVVLYLRIVPDEKDILKASQVFEDKLITSGTLGRLVEPKVIDILRSVAAETQSYDLIRKRRKVVEKMHEECKNKLELHFGLTLEKLAIRRVYFHPIDWTEGCIEMASLIKPDEIIQTTRCDCCGNEGARVYFKPRCFGKGETLLVVEDVPVIFCPNCKEDYLSQETREKIERIKHNREVVAPQRHVSVAVFE